MCVCVCVCVCDKEREFRPKNSCVLLMIDILAVSEILKWVYYITIITKTIFEELEIDGMLKYFSLCNLYHCE